MKEGDMKVVDCNNHVKNAIEFFGKSCAVNSLINKYNPIGDNSDKYETRRSTFAALNLIRLFLDYAICVQVKFLEVGVPHLIPMLDLKERSVV